METRQLRIGNWVENIKSGRKVEVLEVLTTRILIKAAPELRYTKTITSPSSSYKGIELTPELLEQCGFVKREDEYVFWPELQNIEYRLVDFYGWIFSIGFFNWNNEITIIQYLHQLQNLFFALSGEELQVNISK